MRDPGSAARRVAIETLERIDRDHAYANLALSPALERSGLDARDRGLVTDLVYGSLRMRRACDHLADAFLSSDPPPRARAALRVGVYQLAFTEIPKHAAVASTVGAVSGRFRGLVNAVLRRVADLVASPDGVSWPDDATRLSYPDWIVARLRAELGDADALDALETMNLAPSVTTRTDGYVQDTASQLVVDAVGVSAGDVVADLCAAPGGKATGLANAGARVVAMDLRPARVGLIASNVERLELSASVGVVVGDAGVPPLRPASFDHVLLDAPCSGLGVLHRRADARWRVSQGDVDRLASLQVRLLEAAAALVRPGGSLTYSVCTLTRAETIDVAASAPAAWEATQPVSRDARWTTWGSGALLLPQRAGTDGMALFRWRLPSAA